MLSKDDFILFKELKRQPINNCTDLFDKIKGKTRGFFYFTEGFRLDFEYIYKNFKIQRNENSILELRLAALEREIEILKKYDYRNIKLDEKDRLKSPSMPKEKLDLMNNGIAIYKSFDKLFNDEEDTDI